ncbi:MAG: HPr(Ser) kinase/phosphatase [Chlamydiales bacterium]|nr:HPr(Ser) kinase/phosphatase [Chlamydiales bacterium]
MAFVKLAYLFKQHKGELKLRLEAGAKGLARSILVPEVQRPGLALTGYLKVNSPKRILVLGTAEISYLKDLDQKTRMHRLRTVLTEQTPAVFIGRQYLPPPGLIEVCDERSIALFRSRLRTMDLITELNLILLESFAPQISVHASFVEVHGLGVLIQGDSAVGKSETALGLIERGHTLIGDDIVRIKKRGSWVEGSAIELSRHHMEVRGIGIINVANLYGITRIREKKRVDVVVQLEDWDNGHYYDRIGLEEKTTKMLGLDLPFYVVPIKPGRDVVLLLETLALNHKLKGMGYHSAQELDRKLLKLIERKSGKKGRQKNPCKK